MVGVPRLSKNFVCLQDSDEKKREWDEARACKPFGWDMVGKIWR